MNWHYPSVIAHRCGGALAPENTLAGLVIASRLGIRAVEFDAMLSSDGIPVLIHDESLERTTHVQGKVGSTPYAILTRLDAGAHHHAAYSGELLPSLEDALNLCNALGLAANVEIKPAAGTEVDTGRAVAKLSATIDSPHGVVLSSFSAEALQAARETAPTIPRAMLVEQIPADWQDQVQHLGCIGVHASSKLVDVFTARAMRAAGVPLACYTVNTTHEAERLWACGVAAVFTDRIDLFSAAAATAALPEAI